MKSRKKPSAPKPLKAWAVVDPWGSLWESDMHTSRYYAWSKPIEYLRIGYETRLQTRRRLYSIGYRTIRVTIQPCRE